jgi:hypothetical protein
MRETLLVLLFLLLMTIPVYAEQPAATNTNETVSVGNVSNAGGDALIIKTEQMAGDLHQAAKRLIIPITIMVLIVGGLVGIFLPLFRQLIIFAILGLVLILWAPMLVTAINNWASL